MERRVLIVGGVAGGMSAAARLRRLDEAAEIVVFERGPYISFANCGLPYFLGGEIASREKLLVQTPERIREVFNIQAYVRHEVTAIDREQREIEVHNLATGERRRERYDSLLLATGATAIRPSVPRSDRPGQFLLRTIPDMDSIDAWIRDQGAKSAVVVGGGYIGIEAAEQLHHRGLSVHLVDRNPQVLGPLDPEMAALLHLELQSKGIGLHLSRGLARFDAPRDEESARASVVVLDDGTRLPADVIVSGLGGRPETALARAAGLEIGSTGGIRVDVHLRTSDPNIFAAGDAIEVTHGVTGQPALIALGGPANRQGRTAADNICGRPSRYEGTIGTAIVRVFDLTAACTGANERQLKAAGMPFRSVHLHPNSHAGYYPGATPIAIKLLFDPESGRILGAQAVGADGADKRIDVLATAIKGRMTVDDVADLELCYAPPFGSAKDPVNLAGMAAQNIQAADVIPVRWDEVPDMVAGGAVILDVRESREREAGAIPGSQHIPLGQLRSRLAELARDRVILVHCATGQRSYIACRILSQHGYDCRNLSGAYKTWKTARDGTLSRVSRKEEKS